MNDDNVLKNMWKAYHHYNSLAKDEVGYAKEISTGLLKAIEQLEFYYEIKDRELKKFQIFK